MNIEEQKSIVQAVYPNCKCHVRHETMGDWYLLFPEGVDSTTTGEKPIEYSFTSEDHCWNRAARAILHNMVKKLENA
jgi:hypothetical protein